MTQETEDCGGGILRAGHISQNTHCPRRPLTSNKEILCNYIYVCQDLHPYSLSGLKATQNSAAESLPAMKILYLEINPAKDPKMQFRSRNTLGRYPVTECRICLQLPGSILGPWAFVLIIHLHSRRALQSAPARHWGHRRTAHGLLAFILWSKLSHVAQPVHHSRHRDLGSARASTGLWSQRWMSRGRGPRECLFAQVA